MASSINASTGPGGGVATTADASGNLNLQSNGSTVVAMTSTGATVTGTLGVSGVTTLANGAILGTPASGNLVNCVINSKIQPITASAAASALTVTLNPTILDFRSATLTDGTVNTVSIASAISVIVPSTIPLATVSAQQSRLVLVALYNAGTPVLGITNLAGGTNLDETTLVTTIPIAQTSTFTGAIAVTTGTLTLSATGTGTFALGQSLAGTGVPSGTFVKALLTGSLGAAASTYSTNIITAVASTAMTGTAGIGIYSTSAITSSPFRVVGYVESTQATAGTWATTPSTLQGYGGQALAAMSSLGYGQTLQVVTRVWGTTYYNTTGKPISCIINLSATNSSGFFVNGSLVTPAAWFSASVPIGGLVVQAGASYAVNGTSGTVGSWIELR